MQTNWIDTGEHLLRYKYRKGSGPCLVLIHEMGGSVDSWDLVMQHLPTSYTVILPEMRGMGLSEQVRAPFTFRDLAADVDQLLSHLCQTGPAVVAGCAVGGVVALRLALDNPARYAGVLALGPAAGTPKAKRDFVRGIADTLEQDGLRACEDMLLARTYPQEYRARDPKHFEQVRGRWMSNTASSFAAYFRALSDEQMHKDLSHLRSAAIFVAGTQDAFRPPDYVRDLADAVPAAQFHEIDAGHHLADHAPKTVAKLILDCANLSGCH